MSTFQSLFIADNNQKRRQSLISCIQKHRFKGKRDDKQGQNKRRSQFQRQDDKEKKQNWKISKKDLKQGIRKELEKENKGKQKGDTVKTSKPNQNSPFESLFNSDLIKIQSNKPTNNSKLYSPHFINQCKISSMHLNSRYKGSLHLRHTLSIDKPTRIKAKTLNLSQIETGKIKDKWITLPQEPTSIQKILQQHRLFSKKKKSILTDKFKEIVKLSTLHLKNIIQHQPFQNLSVFSKNIIWRVKQTSYFFKIQTLINQVILLKNKYDHNFVQLKEFINYFEFLLCHENLEVFQLQINQLFLIDRNNQNTQSKQHFDQNQSYLIYKNQFQLNDQQYKLKIFVQQNYFKYFLKQEFSNDKLGKKSVEVSCIDQQIPVFNNYQFHAEASNLAQFVPSYEQRSHFLLDKFSQNQNIFQDQQKLKLLLNLSRDPFMPRSSARYITHISTLVENIFGIKEKRKTEAAQQNYEIQSSESQDSDVQQQLKQWDDMFGSLILRI